MQGSSVQLHLALILLALPGGIREVSAVYGQVQDVRIAVAEIPGTYTKGSVEQLWGFGALGSAVDIQDDMWQPRQHDIDRWWINQLNISPLRVWDQQHADIIFVPATLR